jgi:ZIP family zinc transporter
MDYFRGLDPILQVLVATLFTWGMTALGAGLVFITKQFSRKFLDGMLGFTAGVMIAASYWSLLAPAIEISQGKNLPAWFPATVGFLLGGLVLSGADRLLPHLHLGFRKEEAEGIKTSWHRTSLLILAITLHNIPEGLAIGIAFASASYNLGETSFGMAMALALGIGIQNLPEGVAVAMPLRREGFSRLKCFWYGQLSAVVEPVAGVIGAAAILLFQPLLPYAFGFAAGAMIFVVVEEVVPESQRSGDTDLPTIGAILGFVVMMILDVALG